VALILHGGGIAKLSREAAMGKKRQKGPRQEEAKEGQTHPVAVGVGSTAGAVGGAALGSVAGPLGAGVGAVVGGLAGGLAGITAGEAAVREQDDYWRDSFASRPYAAGSSYEEFRPAYRYGWESRARYPDLSFDEAENDLRRGWEEGEGHGLEWERAKQAIRDAWHRVPRRDPRPTT
jgi:phage tail tape-measure protein